MSQQDSFGPATGPLRSPAPPPYGRPGWGQPGHVDHPAAGSPPPGYGYDLGPQRTNVMAILGLVFAFVFNPLGIVFSAIGLSQIRKRGEKGRGLALTGLILSILFLLIGVGFTVVALRSPAFEAALDSAHGAASSSPAADASAAGDGVAGVTAACHTIVPALMNLEADMQDVKTPAQYQQALATLETTLTTAARGAKNASFQQDVAQLNADLEKASAAVQSGQDPSSLESALNADGEAIGEACAAAGVTG